MKTVLTTFGCCLALTLAVAAEDAVSVHFSNAAVTDVLAFYGGLTSKKIVCDNTVQGQITVEAPGTIGKDKAAELIGRALTGNGFSLIDASDDTVSVRGLGRSVRSEGLRIYTRPEELPRDELVCSYLCKIEHRDPVEVASFLMQYSPPSLATAFTPDRTSGTLLITHTSGAIRTLLRLVETLDVPPVPSARRAAEERKARMAPPEPPDAAPERPSPPEPPHPPQIVRPPVVARPGVVRPVPPPPVPTPE